MTTKQQILETLSAKPATALTAFLEELRRRGQTGVAMSVAFRYALQGINSAEDLRREIELHLK